MFGVGAQVAHVGLGVPGDAVQHDQRRLAGVTGVQVPGPERAGLDEPLAELHSLQVGPDTGERAGADRGLGHDSLQCGLVRYVLAEMR